ncbi:MAG TPA: hypothetical protein PLR50_05010, partial [Candidatus Rifleibacterium sp.]|nr:hypothetical protein [Candidatus Rifleibacterium sp.]
SSLVKSFKKPTAQSFNKPAEKTDKKPPLKKVPPQKPIVEKQEKKPNPAEIIALDDDEFGKY